MLKIIPLFLLLFIAGIVHLISPEKFLFLYPHWVPYKVFSIYLSGVFEISLAVGLLTTRYRHLSATLTALFFVFLELFHLYVAFNEIPMLGSTNPYFLWGRVLAQFVLIYWAWSLRRNSFPRK